MKKSKNAAVTVIVIAVLAALSALYAHFSLKTNTVRVVFYDLNETEVAAISSWLDENGVDYNKNVFDSSKPLSDLISGSSQYDMLFICDGANMDSMQPIVRNAETAALQILPLPVRIAVQTDRRLIGTPVLIDPFALLCRKDSFARLHMSEPLSFEQLENAAARRLLLSEREKGTSPAPFVCAGGNDDHLIRFFSSVLEAAEGADALEEAVALLDGQAGNSGKSGQNDFSAFFSFEPVNAAVERLADWQKRGFLSSKWLELTSRETAAAMEASSALIVFAPWSFYGSLNEKTADDYALWYMPGRAVLPKRAAVVRTVAALQFSVPKSALQSAAQARKKLDSVRALIREAVSSISQTKLAQSAMLVPVNPNAESSLPAALALSYVCAADAMVPDAAQAALTTKDRRAAFAQEIRKRIRAAAAR